MSALLLRLRCWWNDMCFRHGVPLQQTIRFDMYCPQCNEENEDREIAEFVKLGKTGKTPRTGSMTKSELARIDAMVLQNQAIEKMAVNALVEIRVRLAAVTAERDALAEALKVAESTIERLRSLTHGPTGELWRETALARLDIMDRLRELCGEAAKRLRYCDDYPANEGLLDCVNRLQAAAEGREV